jgi:DNA-binding beta-propeller fold protein YncE
VSLTVTARYACGTNAEGMAITADGKTLYVANSDGYTYKGSISAINLTDGTTKTIENSGIKNPTRIFVVNGQVYFLDMGSYDQITWTQSGEGLYRLTDNGSVKLTEASEVKYHAGKFYMYHARYGETATYSVYDLSTGKESTFIDGTDIAAPATIAIDPVLGSVIITSYNLSGGYADYSTDGYAVIYDAAGIKQKQFVTGVGPTTVVFNTVLK